MDPFDDLLRGVRATDAGFERKELTSPLRFTGETALTLLAPLRGEGRLTPGSRPLRVGETVVVRGPFAVHVTDPMVLLVGTYDVRGAVARRLLDVLPPVLAVPDGDGCESTWDFLGEQAGCGPQVVRDRLLDWLLVCILRDWFDRSPVPPGWIQALSDDVTGPVLRAMHATPDRPWTLAALAREAGVSRTTLASRFTRLVGDPPLTYLTDWRMTLAADLLTESTATVASVARRVGYADAFGFSSAFKRFHGMSPSACRRTCV